jgi:hypothetical protein
MQSCLDGAGEEFVGVDAAGEEVECDVAAGVEVVVPVPGFIPVQHSFSYPVNGSEWETLMKQFKAVPLSVDPILWGFRLLSHQPAASQT